MTTVIKKTALPKEAILVKVRRLKAGDKFVLSGNKVLDVSQGSNRTKHVYVEHPDGSTSSLRLSSGNQVWIVRGA